MKVLLILLTFLIFINNLFSQAPGTSIDGMVFGTSGNSKEPLTGAVVKWINTKKGTITESDGKFHLEAENISDKRIIVSFGGYNSDTISIGEKNFVTVNLKNNTTTNTIVVEDQQKSSFISNDAPKTEVITFSELKKDACCDLSGCFGKNASVDVAVTDILTNTKELKVLGLEGSYTQILIDNLPIMTGLVTKFGVTSLPGSLINKINISKGSNSVIQGYESISGIMNVLLKDYSSSDKLFVNGYLNSSLEPQFNLNATTKLNDNLSTFFAFQTIQDSKKIDNNGDGFLDAPLTRRYMVFNKWSYGSLDEEDKTNVMVAFKYLDERRIGGQTNFNYDTDLGSNSIYGQTVNIKNGDVYSRLSHVFKNKSQMKVFLSGGFFNQLSYFGTTVYDARQRNFYGNALYELPVAKKGYLRFGASYRFEEINEDISFLVPVNKTYAGNYDKYESVPGVYTEASFEFKDLNLSLIGGLRLDFHNLYGNVTTPRFLARYQMTKNTVIRASVGTGFRVVSPFSEYPSFLASGKNIKGVRDAQPEKMINYGVDVLQYFVIAGFSGNVSVDFYRTDFSNKVIAECDAMPYMYMFTNFADAGSNVFQVESSVNFLQNLDFKIAYKFIDLYYFKNGNRLDQPFNSKNRVLFGITYTYPQNLWVFNANVQWFGVQNIPSTEKYPVQYQRALTSDPYTLVNVQVTKNFRTFELYAGVENLMNFTQENPIISADNPFNKNFDTSYIWGPTRGRDFYFGFRFFIK